MWNVCILILLVFVAPASWSLPSPPTAPLLLERPTSPLQYLKGALSNSKEWTFSASGSHPRLVVGTWRQDHYPTELRLQLTNSRWKPEIQGQFLHYNARYIMLTKNIIDESVGATQTLFPHFKLKFEKVTFVKGQEHVATTSVRIPNDRAGHKFIKILSAKLSSDAADL